MASIIPPAAKPTPDAETGWIDRLPAALQPYARLARLDRPAGSWLLFWPCAWGVALAVVTLTPLTEEVVWRGAVQQALKRLGIPRLAAIGCTSVLFAMVHWNAVPDASRLSALPALAMLGFALGWLMERTGRLIAPVVAHAAFNAANLLLFSMLG